MKLTKKGRMVKLFIPTHMAVRYLTVMSHMPVRYLTDMSIMLSGVSTDHPYMTAS